jgi:hypothetical protein
VDVF